MCSCGHFTLSWDSQQACRPLTLVQFSSMCGTYFRVSANFPLEFS